MNYSVHTRYAVFGRIWGYIFLALGLALGSGLGFLFYNADAQIVRRAQVDTEFRELAPSDDALELLKNMKENGQIANRLFLLTAEYERIQSDADNTWGDLRKDSPVQFYTLSFVSYLGIFRAPQHITTRIGFVPGIFEMLILLALGCYFLWRSGKEPVEEEPAAT